MDTAIKLMERIAIALEESAKAQRHIAMTLEELQIAIFKQINDVNTRTS